MVAAARERGKRERKGWSRATGHVPFRHGLSSFALSSLLSLSLSLASRSFAFCSSPPYIFRFLPCIVSTMIHWIPRNVFHEATPKGVHTYAQDTHCHTHCHTRDKVQRIEWSLSHFRILPSSKELNFLPASPLACLPVRLSPSVPMFQCFALTPTDILREI